MAIAATLRPAKFIGPASGDFHVEVKPFDAAPTRRADGERTQQSGHSMCHQHSPGPHPARASWPQRAERPTRDLPRPLGRDAPRQI